jgi:hypothetical protein
LPAGLRGWDGTYSLFPLRAKPVLSLGQMKAKEFNSVLANLGLFPRDFISCLPQKKKKGCSLHIVFSSWSSQQEVIYVLEESAAVLFS